MTDTRSLRFAVPLVAGGLAALAVLAAPAAAQEPPDDPPAAGAACAVTGYVVSSSQELSTLRAALAGEPVHTLDGVPLDRMDTWVLPDGGMPVVVVDSTAPVHAGQVTVAVAGSSFPVRPEMLEGDDRFRYVSNATIAPLGPIVRTVGLEVRTDDCTAAVTLTVDRSIWSTAAGGTGTALMVLFGALTVLVARLRKGGWLRRFLFAAPLGLVAGLGQAVVLLEAVLISPFATFPWWLPALGVVLAAVLPLTRWRRRAARPVDAVPLPQVAGSLSDLQAVNVALGMLAGLAAPHARGQVHGTLAPERVWIAPDGRVALADPDPAGAAAPGGGSYQSPEQRAGAVPSARGDLYAVAAVLRELLTGPVPAGVAAVLDRAQADDPGRRPDSAEQFATELRAAADEAYGPDWPGRGALAGAVTAHGAVGAAAAGYGIAGTAGGGAAPAGTAAGLGAAAGAGGLGTAGLGSAAPGAGAAAQAAAQAAPAPVQAGAAATGAAGTGAAGTGAAGTGAAAGAGTAAGAAVSSKAGGLVNAAVAVGVGAVVAVGVVLVDPGPAQAQESVVITPEQARVIFVRTMDEAREGDDQHLADPVPSRMEDLLAVDAAIATAPLVAVEVGVPPEQYTYPAWFAASAQIGYDDQTAYLLARLDREAADQPWLMTAFAFSAEDELGAPALDDDGWLSPAPEAATLLVDPADLPARYHAWFGSSFDAREVVDDEVLAPRTADSAVRTTTENLAEFAAGGGFERTSIRWEPKPQQREPGVVPLAGGGALVSFGVVAVVTNYNSADHVSGPCDTGDFGSWRWLSESGGRYQLLVVERVTQVFAWVPAADAAGVLVEDHHLTPDQLLEEASIPC